jgi:hypothetical protein
LASSISRKVLFKCLLDSLKPLLILDILPEAASEVQNTLCEKESISHACLRFELDLLKGQEHRVHPAQGEGRHEGQVVFSTNNMVVGIFQ